MPFAGRAARVDVDRHQRLGRVDHQISTRAELDDRVVYGVDLNFHLVAEEQRNIRIVVAKDFFGVARHHGFHEILGGAKAFLALDEHLVDVLAVEVADRSLDEVGLFMDKRRGDRFHRGVADFVPQLGQILVVALDLRLRAFGAGGAHDDRHAARNLEIVEYFLEPLAVLGAVDLAADPAAARRVRHQHAIASREGEIAGQRRSLVAALLLDDLNQQDLAPLDDFLNLVVPVVFEPLAFDLFDFIAADGFHRIRILVVLGVLKLAVFRQQLLAVGDRDLIIVRVDFTERQETVAIAAVIDEGRLQGRLYPDDLGQVDVTL